MNEPDSRVIDGRVDFQAAVSAVLQAASTLLRIHDRDLSDLGLDSAAAAQQLRRLLRTPGGGVRLVVHDAQWLQTQAPRLAELRRHFDATLQCRLAPAGLALRDGLLIGDDRHLLHRSTPTGWRGRFGLDLGSQVQDLATRFEALWTESMPLPGGRSLGL